MNKNIIKEELYNNYEQLVRLSGTFNNIAEFIEENTPEALAEEEFEEYEDDITLEELTLIIKEIYKETRA